MAFRSFLLSGVFFRIITVRVLLADATIRTVDHNLRRLPNLRDSSGYRHCFSLSSRSCHGNFRARRLHLPVATTIRCDVIPLTCHYYILNPGRLTGLSPPCYTRDAKRGKHGFPNACFDPGESARSKLSTWRCLSVRQNLQATPFLFGLRFDAPPDVCSYINYIPLSSSCQSHGTLYLSI